MAVDSSDEDLIQEREIGLGKLNSTDTGLGSLVEVFLYKGVEIHRTGEDELTTFVTNAMTLEEGVIVAGYIVNLNVYNLRPPYWFRIEQLFDADLENNHVDVDYATVHSIFNHQGCKIVSRP